MSNIRDFLSNSIDLADELTLRRDDRLRQLEDKLNEMASEHDGCLMKMKNLEDQLRIFEQTKAAEIAKIKREQTEADRFFAAAKVVVECLGKSPDQEYYEGVVKKLWSTPL